MNEKWPSGRKKGWSFEMSLKPTQGPQAAVRPQSQTDCTVAQIELDGSPLKAGERGLIISCPVELTTPDSLRIVSSAPDPEELRMALLFWDRLDWPDNNMIGIADGSIDLLVHEGVLSRSKAYFSGGGGMAEFAVEAQKAVYDELAKSAPGCWALGRGKNSISVLHNTGPNELRSLLVELHRAIPVPSADVPYEDVLAFRLKRRDQLLALRENLEGMYQQVLAAPDRPLAETGAFRQIEEATGSVARVMKEDGIKSFMSTLREAFSFDTIADEAAKPLLAGLLTGGVVAFTKDWAAGTAAGLAISAAKSLRRSFKHPSIGTPYEYVYRIHKDLPWVR